MAIRALLFSGLSLFLFRALYLALLKQGKERDESRATGRLKPRDPEEEVDPSSSNCEGNSSSNKKFDVFISHRGPDTKLTLAYHMYDLLCDRGVEVFFDKEELQSGERFPLAIKEAIACSKVDVCILSSGFAESVWCLKELQMMVDKYEMGKSKLIPIFYDVKPCDVRHLQGAFGQGFQKKIVDKNRYTTQLINKWRQSLYTIAGITGPEGKGECCRAIVDKILQELDVGLRDVSSNIVGRQEELLNMKHTIMKCCQNGCGVTSVEISGMGGIGKTTFAEQLYNQICPQYERCCFIKDVGGIVEKSGLNEVYNQLISKLLRYDPSNSKMEGKEILKIRLRNAKILVVFDNIHSKIPLSTVFIEDDVSLDPSSIIIATSREKDVLKHDPRVALYCKNLIPLELSRLDLHSSSKLFCQYAFGGTHGNMTNEFDEVRKSIIEKCHGIPLALKLLGIQLYNREIKFWKIFWNSLKDSLCPDLKAILKISYDNLDTELEKCLFLDVATFLLLEKEALLVQLRRQRNDKKGESDILLALAMLKKKNLIEVEDGLLKMHDLLVELGRSIVQDEDPCPGHRSRVWDPSDVRNILCGEEMGTNKVKALSLVFRGSPVLNDGCPWPADAFRKLSSLEFLILQGPCIEGDLSKLSKRLSWLKWTDFPYEYIHGCIEHVKVHVKVLQLSGGRLTLLWKHEEDTPINLRQLSLSNCMNLKRLPEFTVKLRHLSCIELKECTSLESIPDSFGQLQALKYLELKQCEALVLLPETFGDLRSLCTLKMIDCCKIKSLPESFGKLLQLQELKIDGCRTLQCLPESFGKLLQLRELIISWCHALECLPESFGKLLQLRKLIISSCDALECLPESFGTLSELETLKMWHCRALQCLPESFGTLLRLETLEIDGCRALQCLPESFGKLLQLRKLDICECRALKCLPKSFGHLHRLEALSIRYCNCLEELTESFGELMNLLKLEVVGGHKIRFPVEQFQCLQRIRDLSIGRYKCNVEIAYSSCGKTGGIEQQNNDCWNNSNWYGQASQQQHLTSLVRNVSPCPRVKRQNRDAADDNEHAPPSLSDVELIANHFQRRFESGSDTLQQMHQLFVHGFWNLQELPQSVGNLGHLRTLNLSNCANLQWLPDSVIDSLSSLQDLCLDHCLNLKVIPACIGNLSQLKELRLRSCWNFEELPDTIGNLQNLQVLEIDDCIVLKGLPSRLWNISSLTTLRVLYCWMVEVIHMQGLVNLERLEVIGCVNLRSIEGLSVLPRLSDLTIKGCLNLRDMAILRGWLKYLQSLSICGCYQLCLPNESLVKHLPDKFSHLKLSLNHDSLEASLDEEKQTIPNILRWWSSHVRTKCRRVLNAKTSPLLFEAVEKRVRHLLSTKDDYFHSFYKLSHVPSKDHCFDFYFDSSFHEVSHETPACTPTREYPTTTALLCFVSAVDAVNFPMHIPPPQASFRLCMINTTFDTCQRFDCGEEIHIVKINRPVDPQSFLYSQSWKLRIGKARDYRESCEAFVKEGWLILLEGDDDTGLSTEIYNIFCSEVMKQRWLSRAWTELPSQLCISEFSALDIANCQITKTSRHFNTYVMKEESGLTWKRRRCLFIDDHALQQENSRENSSKHGFLAYPGLHLDLEAGVFVNLYEMSISVSIKGKPIHSRKLQEIVSINEQEIPVALNTLLRTNASHSTLAALQEKITRNLRNKYTSFGFR